MILRLATRNIFRNRWRTFLTLAGVAVGVAMLSWTLAYFNGFISEMVKSATSISVGQVQISSEDYIETPMINHTFSISEKELDSIRALKGVVNISPRIQVYGLVGNDKHSAVAQIIGVDPENDAKTTSVSTAIQKGEWLKSSKPKDQKSPDKQDEDTPRKLPEAILGHMLAQQIGVEVGDELVVFFEAADGALGNELLQIKGILKSGNSAIDRAGVFMDIKILQEIAALDDQYHIAPIKISNISQSETIATQISAMIQNDSDTKKRKARSWGEIIPAIKQIVDVSDGANYIYLLFIYFIVAFGLFNASRMSALERQREFAMMLAIGVPRKNLFWTTLLETLVISILGAFFGTLIGSGLAWYHSIYGLDMSSFSGTDTEGFSYMGVNFSSVIYFALSPSTVFVPFIAVVPVGLLCGVWPAIQAARTHILTSISNRN